MKRVIALIMALIMCLTVLTGCQSAHNPTGFTASQTQNGGASGGASGGAVVQPKLSPAALPEPDYSDGFSEFKEKLNAFAFRMTSALIEQGQTDEAGLICSPLSVSYTLAAVLNGVEGDAQTTLLEAMGLDGMTPEEVNRFFGMLLNQLTVPDEWTLEEDPDAKKPVTMANAVFLNRNYTLVAEYAQKVMDCLRAEVFSVDFESDEALDALNCWCNEKTEGLIPKIVEELDPDTVAAIANAIYFSDRWEYEFDPENNETLTFHTPGGDRDALFMVRDGDFTYYEDDGMQVVFLPFVQGGSLAVLLPKDGDASALLSGMDYRAFNEIRQDAQLCTGTVKLPRFSMDATLDLPDTLTALGLGELFDTNALVITAMTEGDELYISDAVQKAAIEVSETGTTAAAVTVMMIKECAMIMPEENAPFEMICDSPFAFVVFGNCSDVLFTGTVNQVGE